jgi:hypothetical protein
MDKHIIVGVHVVGRNEHAVDLQRVFTEYGCQIKTRIGLHDVHEGFCSPNGLIVLETIDAPETQQMIDTLKALEGVDVQTMVFDH